MTRRKRARRALAVLIMNIGIPAPRGRQFPSRHRAGPRLSPHRCRPSCVSGITSSTTFGTPPNDCICIHRTQPWPAADPSDRWRRPCAVDPDSIANSVSALARVTATAPANLQRLHSDCRRMSPDDD
jgi:hypothetical protein